MISARMSRSVRVLLISSASIAVAALGSACGTEKISVRKSDPTYTGAVLFSQRCSGCHTLSYAATHGSANNPRTAQFNNGPNFDVRCERPVTRVLYAIENGGFSGAIMPQNIVVAHDATLVAEFVAKYAGRQSPKVTGQPSCESQPIGILPAPPASTTTPTGATTTTTTAATTSTASHAKTGVKKKKK
jgi:mono/diheme cytochrome c family protein